MGDKATVSRRWAAAGVTGVLLVGLLVLNTTAIRQIVAARRDARQMAQRELELRLEERGQAYRARLANLRADLVALAESPPMQRIPERLASPDPLVRRWARLDAQGSLALFAQSHPALTELWLSIAETTDTVRVGRRNDVVLILDPREQKEPAGDHFAAMKASLPTNRDAWVRGWVDLSRILDGDTEPGFEAFTLETTPPRKGGQRNVVAAVEIEDPHWDPPIRAWLVSRQMESQVERSVATLAGRYRRTVVWNLLVIVALTTAVVMMLQQMRRRTEAETAAANERRIRDLERSLLHSERLASIGRFAAGIAHEVNNPLEGMGNYLSLVGTDLDAGNTVEARDHLARVREGLDRAAAIVRRVLAYSEPAHSPKELIAIELPLRQAIEFLQPRFPEVKIDFAGTSTGALVLANPVALGQLFLNLLLNACEAQEDRGEIDVLVAEDDSTVMVTIRDSGPGLSEESLDHLFEPFYSTRGSTGLGLAVCHGIVEDHGGEIGADNAPEGSGAVFEVRLPKRSTSEAITA